MIKGQFTLEDWLEQIKQVKKIGSMSQIMDLLPAQFGQAARHADPENIERSIKQSEAIIFSMTLKERRNPELLNASRRWRIAAGSGTEVQEINRLLKQFREAQKLMKLLQKSGGRSLPKLWGQ